jgi:hypothetical protein
MTTYVYVTFSLEVLFVPLLLLSKNLQVKTFLRWACDVGTLCRFLFVGVVRLFFPSFALLLVVLEIVLSLFFVL